MHETKSRFKSYSTYFFNPATGLPSTGRSCINLPADRWSDGEREPGCDFFEGIPAVSNLTHTRMAKPDTADSPASAQRDLRWAAHQE